MYFAFFSTIYVQIPPPLEDMPFPEQTALETDPGTEESMAQPEIEELVIKRPPLSDTPLGQEAGVGGIFSSQSPLQNPRSGRGPVSLLLSRTTAAEDEESGMEGDAGLLQEQPRKTFVTELGGASEHEGEGSSFLLEVGESHGFEVSNLSTTCGETNSGRDWNRLPAKEVTSPPVSSGSLPAKPSSSMPLLVKGSTEKPEDISEQLDLLTKVSEGATSLSRDTFKPLIEVIDPTGDDRPLYSATLLPQQAQERLEKKEETKASDVEEPLPRPKDSFRPFIEVAESSNSTPCPLSATTPGQQPLEEAREATSRSDTEAPVAWAQTVVERPLITEVSDNGGKEELQVEDIEGLGRGVMRGLDAREEEVDDANRVSLPPLTEKGSEEMGTQESKLAELAETVGSTLNCPPPDTKLYQELKKKWSKHTS